MLAVWDKNAIEQAAQALRQGKILAYPTEGVWGLGVDPNNEQAFGQLLKLKQRKIDKGVILIAGTTRQIENWLVHLNNEQKEMVLSTWPGHVTWLVPKPDLSPEWISGEHPYVALRVSAHPLVQQLCQHFGGPIVSTSANTAGDIPAKTIKEAQSFFGNQVEYLLGVTLGAAGPSQIRNALTGAIIRL